MSSTPKPNRVRLLLALLLGLSLVWSVTIGLRGAQPAPTRQALELHDGQAAFDVWPALRILADPEGKWSAVEAARHIDRFEFPAAPSGSLGARPDVMWLYVPLQVVDGDGRWVLDVNYPALNDIQVHLIHQGELRTLPLLGSAQPFSHRPMPTRSHALSLQLQPGQPYALLMRVQTQSAMVLPITLSKPDTFMGRESHMLLGQGLMLGLALALLVYSLAHALSLREPLFVFYAVMLLGSTVFFVDFFGIGQMVLWSERRGLTAMLSPLSVMLAMAAGTQFVIRSMDLRLRHPSLYRSLQALSALSAAILVLGLLGFLNYQQAQWAATVVGPVVPLLVIPAAWKLARCGDPVGRYMLIGWSAYLIGASTMAALLRGLLPANFWTLHLFQWGTAMEMLVWLRVLGLHIESVRNEALRNAAEKKHLESLACTDALTGLPNRRGMYNELQTALANCSHTQLLAVFMADLDGFKAVNDRLGHEAGDLLLQQVAARLKGSLRHGDTVSRLGGDEFVILAPGLAQDSQALLIGNKLLQALAEPFDVNGQTCRVGLTVGYAIAPQDGLDSTELLREADNAMYAGKQAGRRQVRRFAPTMANA